MIVFPNCKINIGLAVTEKRSDGYHDLETVFYPVKVHDALEVFLLPDKPRNHIEFRPFGRQVTSNPQKNICVKAYWLLVDKLGDLPAVEMLLYKQIPSGAGLGGGSADAAFALMLLNEQLQLGLSKRELANFALDLGSDCPFFIFNKPMFAKGRGEEFTSLNLDLSNKHFVLVHPGIHISTAQAFGGLKPRKSMFDLKNQVLQPIAHWKNLIENDFEATIFPEYPQIAELKQWMYERGAIYASMTGTGSTVYGIFEQKPQISQQFPKHYTVFQV